MEGGSRKAVDDIGIGVGVESSVSQELIEAVVILVCTRTRNSIENPATRSSVFRRVRAYLNLELLNGFKRSGIGDVIGGRIENLRAVEKDIVGIRSTAVNGSSRAGVAVVDDTERAPRNCRGSVPIGGVR
jgi:hypothetical protein